MQTTEIPIAGTSVLAIVSTDKQMLTLVDDYGQVLAQVKVDPTGKVFSAAAPTAVAEAAATVTSEPVPVLATTSTVA